ncbi:hypothetical protein Hanom_Chr09g00796391 [Helianthus anomalus]
MLIFSQTGPRVCFPHIHNHCFQNTLVRPEGVEVPPRPPHLPQRLEGATTHTAEFKEGAPWVVRYHGNEEEGDVQVYHRFQQQQQLLVQSIGGFQHLMGEQQGGFCYSFFLLLYNWIQSFIVFAQIDLRICSNFGIWMNFRF